MSNPVKITVQVEGFLGPKIQAIKALRTFAQEFNGIGTLPATLRGAKDIIDAAERGEKPTFEIRRMPGAKLVMLRHSPGQIDAKVISTSGVFDLQLTGEEVGLVLRALDSYGYSVKSLDAAEGYNCERLTQQIGEQT